VVERLDLAADVGLALGQGRDRVDLDPFAASASRVPSVA
jgi:hypothetical protein